MDKETQHPYCYPGTDVLINKLGIKTAEKLERSERLISAARLETLADQPLSPAGMRAVHKHLFEQLYDWSGTYRTVTIGRGRIPFCKAEYIDKQVEK